VDCSISAERVYITWKANSNMVACKMCSMAFGVEVRQGQMYQITEAESLRFGLRCYGMPFLLENQNMHEYSAAFGAVKGLWRWSYDEA
jgi:hypothetical protein